MDFYAEGCEYFHHRHYDKALEMFEQLPNSVEKIYSIATTHMNMRTEDDLIKAFKYFDMLLRDGCRDARVVTNMVETSSLLSRVYEESDRSDLAIEVLLGAHKNIKTNHVLNYNLGRAYEKRGMPEEAIKLLEAAIKDEGERVDYYLEMNLALREIGDVERCRKYLLEGIEKADKKEPLYKELGNLLSMGDPEKAIELYKMALTSKMDVKFLATVYMNMGNCFLKQCDPKTAIEYYVKSFQVDGTFEVVPQNYAMAILYDQTCDEASVWKANQHIGEVLKTIFKIGPEKPLVRQIGTKIRVGFISADIFGTHPVVHFIKRLLNEIDTTNKFEIHCYCNQFLKGKDTSVYSKDIKWYGIKNVSRQRAAEMIERAQLDILVDMSGYTEGARCDLMCSRHAPVQMTYIGYPMFPGMSIDYFVGDSVMKPTVPELVEKMYVIPTCYTQYTPPFQPTIIPRDNSKFVVFGALNKANKINKLVRETYISVLKAVPSSCLVVKDVNVYKVIVKEYPEYKDRLSYLGILPDYKEFVHSYNKIDIALDSFPWSGTTTTCESLLMGVPVITWVCEEPPSPYHQKSSASILTHSNMGKFVAKTLNDFVRLASNCARNIQSVPNYKEQVQGLFLDGNVVKAPNYIREVEQMFQEIIFRK